MTSPRVYVFAAVLILALSVLVLTRNVPSKTAQSGNISVLNKTSTFQVISAQQVNDRLSLSLKNNSAHTVTAFVITVGSELRITEDFVTSEIPDKIGISLKKHSRKRILFHRPCEPRQLHFRRWFLRIRLAMAIPLYLKILRTTIWARRSN